MLTIVWNPNGFHLIDAMPEWEKYRARYYSGDTVTLICQQLTPAGKRKLLIHADNSRCHTANVILDSVSQ
jgi:hypothetical protein